MALDPPEAGDASRPMQSQVFSRSDVRAAVVRGNGMQRDVKFGASISRRIIFVASGSFVWNYSHVFSERPGLSVPSPSVKPPQNAGVRERPAGDRLDRLD